eukprot:1098721-Heterocapsa_arctica.AAC.1
MGTTTTRQRKDGQRSADRTGMGTTTTRQRKSAATGRLESICTGLSAAALEWAVGCKQWATAVWTQVDHLREWLSRVSLTVRKMFSKKDVDSENTSKSEHNEQKVCKLFPLFLKENTISRTNNHINEEVH